MVEKPNIVVRPFEFFVYLFHVLQDTRKSILLNDVSRIRELVLTDINKEYTVDIPWTKDDVMIVFDLFSDCMKLKDNTVRWVYKTTATQVHSYIAENFNIEQFDAAFVAAVKSGCETVLSKVDHNG